MNMNKLWLAAGLIAFGVIAFVVFAPNKGNEQMAMGDTNGTHEMETANLVTSPVTGAKEVTVVASNFSFSPSMIKVNKGDKVSITFQNVDGFHDFKIDEFQVSTKRISAGQEDVVNFTADKSGTFEYYCSVGNHRAMGMKGTLIVE